MKMKIITLIVIFIISSPAFANEKISIGKDGCKVFIYPDDVNRFGFTSTWNGQCKNGLANGNGVLKIYENGKISSSFKGDIRDGKKIKGSIDIIDDDNENSHFDGKFNENEMIGVWTYRGDRYEGKLRNWRFEGNGKYFFKDGTKYEGEFSNGEFNGFGTLYLKAGDARIAEFEKDGYGKRIGNGYAFTGIFKDSDIILYCQDKIECKKNEFKNDDGVKFITHADCIHFDDYKDQGNGTVVDARTGLQWKRCFSGWEWDGTTCSGLGQGYTWFQAINAANNDSTAGKNDWRLATLEEFNSIIDKGCRQPGFNPNVFRSNDPDGRWNPSWALDISNKDSLHAGFVNFAAGETHPLKEDDIGGVRPILLVRGGNNYKLFELALKYANSAPMRKMKNEMAEKKLESDKYWNERVKKTKIQKDTLPTPAIIYDWPYKPELSSKSWTIRCGSGADVTITKGDSGIWHGVNINVGASLDQAMREICGQ